MVIKMFISGISASKEVKKHQLRAQFLLESYKIKYETVDITDPNTEELKQKMFTEAKRRNESSVPHPPQFFNEDHYCGDFEDLENANDNNELFTFLGLEEDIAIENGFGKGDDEDYDFSGLLKKPKDDEKSEEDAKEEVKVEEDEAEVEEEVVEQVTINGVVYIIPPDRKITVGGRVIDVDELLEAQGEEVDLDEVDENLKKKLEKSEENGESEDKDNDQVGSDKEAEAETEATANDDDQKKGDEDKEEDKEDEEEDEEEE